MRRLERLARPGALHPVDFQAPGALDAFPMLDHGACMEAMHAVTPDGRVFRGAEAAARALATRRVVGWLAYAYYLWGPRQLCDALYRWTARRRYRLAGRDCDGGTCHLHPPGGAP